MLKIGFTDFHHRSIPCAVILGFYCKRLGVSVCMCECVQYPRPHQWWTRARPLSPLQGLNALKRTLCVGGAGMAVEPSVFGKQTAKVNGTFVQLPTRMRHSQNAPLPHTAN